MRGKTLLVAMCAVVLSVGLCACAQQGSSSSSTSASSSSQSASSSSASTSGSSASPSSADQSSASATASQSSAFVTPRASSSASEPGIVPTHAYATMQDVFDAPGESVFWDVNEHSFGFLFKDGSRYVLVRAELPEGMSAQVESAYIENNMDAICDLVGPLPVYDEYTVDSPTNEQIDYLSENLVIR